MRCVHRGSVTRIATLPDWPFPVRALDSDSWETGDYVLAEVLPGPADTEDFELRSGRSCRPLVGDFLVGALAERFATLEATGSYRAVGEDGVMHCLTEGGCFGALTSKSRFSKRLMRLRYRGHVIRDGEKLTMRGAVEADEGPSDRPMDIPVVLLVGTSMSAGKTHSGGVAIRQLVGLGHTVVAAKLTGAGRWHDTLSFVDAGATQTFDFVDAGLPTTVVPPDTYAEAVKPLLGRMADTRASVAVIEAGASPLEPYNGGTLVDLLADQVRFTILAASDPYAVVGIQQAWGKTFDLVVGPTANTKAGVALVHELAGLPALDLFDGGTHSSLRQRLEAAVGSHGAG